MFTMNEIKYVPANEIWPNAKPHMDKGYKPGLVRGYNVEGINSAGESYWFSSEFIHGNPNEELFDEMHMFWYSDCGYQPTGRICFRGYAREYYDEKERETFVKILED